MAERALIFLFSDASDVYLKIYPQEVELMMETKTKHYLKLKVSIVLFAVFSWIYY
jgi:hypothetical protein